MNTRSKFASTVALGVAAVLALSACSESNPDPEVSKEDGSYSAGGVTLDGPAERIVSLSPTATEMLYAIGAEDQIAAVDQQSNYPEEVKPGELDAFAPNVEAIAGKDPDLVVLSHDQDGIIGQLEEVDIPVYSALAATSVDDVYQQIDDLAALTGHINDAETVTSDMQKDFDKISEDVPETDEPLTAYYALDTENYSLTSQTFAGSLMDQAGFENIADDADDAKETGGYPKLSAESIVDADPDVIFVAAGGEEAAKEIAGRDGWDSIEAVEEDQVVVLDDDIASRWGPRMVDLYAAFVDAAVQAA